MYIGLRSIVDTYSSLILNRDVLIKSPRNVSVGNVPNLIGNGNRMKSISRYERTILGEARGYTVVDLLSL